MNALNRFTGALFDVVLKPFELMGPEVTLVLVSGIFGIIALLVFKQISWQAGIKRTKDRIKADMIAIRLYQDDLGVVASSVGKVVLRNFQYLGLNFLPILPLLPPFALVLSQFVVRYGFEPLPVTKVAAADVMPGKGTLIEIGMKKADLDAAGKLEVRYPQGIQQVSPLVRNAFEGVAFQEVIATAPVDGDIQLLVDGKVVGTKRIAAGDVRERKMQPERVSGFWSSWLWPAEPTFGPESPVAHVKFDYPSRDLRWLPDGETGILITFAVASILFGALILKPLHIQI